MLKFERQNIMQLAKENKTAYIYFDILRQTTIERIVKNSKQNKNDLVRDLTNLTRYLLDKMIKEDK